MPVTARTDTHITAKRYLGRPYTGKTESLIKDLAAVIENCTQDESAAVFCATPQTALEFRTRLEERQGKNLEQLFRVFIGTPREYALRLLGTDKAYTLTGRKARVLNRLETNILVEDVKTCGIRPGRLRAMLGFFFRSWTELKDDDEHWLISDEERELHALVKSELRLLEGVLEPELSNLARKVLLELRDNNSAADLGATEIQRGAHHLVRIGFDHVFVDDYQLLSRASQQLCCSLAQQSVTIGADPFGCVQAYESYPYAAGIEEFAELSPHTKTVELSTCFQSDAVHSACMMLIEQEGLEAISSHSADTVPKGNVEAVVFKSPDEERTSIARLVAQRAKSRDELRDVIGASEGRDVVIAVPNTTWASDIAHKLQALGAEALFHPDPRPWIESFENGSTNALTTMLCALRLVADSTDYPAWRSWCAFGDGMANSPAFDGIRDACASQEITLIEALDSLSSGTLRLKKGSIGTERVIEAYREGLRIHDSLQGLRGMNLLEQLSRCIGNDGQEYAIDAIVQLILTGSHFSMKRSSDWNHSAPTDRSAEIAQLDQERSHEALCLSQMTASEMLWCIREAFEGPLVHGGDAIAVLTYREAVCVKAEEVYVAGFVNGFVPSSDWFDLTVTPLGMQAKKRLADAQFVNAIASAARDKLVFSAFTSVSLDYASKAKLKVDRIRIEDGVRMASISPSIFLSSFNLHEK